MAQSAVRRNHLKNLSDTVNSILDSPEDFSMRLLEECVEESTDRYFVITGANNQPIVVKASSPAQAYFRNVILYSNGLQPASNPHIRKKKIGIREARSQDIRYARRVKTLIESDSMRENMTRNIIFYLLNKFDRKKLPFERLFSTWSKDMGERLFLFAATPQQAYFTGKLIAMHSGFRFDGDKLPREIKFCPYAEYDMSMMCNLNSERGLCIFNSLSYEVPDRCRYNPETSKKQGEIVVLQQPAGQIF